MSTFECFQLFSYLEALPGFRGLDHEPNQPVTAAALSAWHEANEPFKLPADLTCFLETCDGFNLKWRAVSLQAEVIVGHLEVNPLHQISRLSDAPSMSGRTNSLCASIESDLYVAFEIACNSKVGAVCLVFEESVIFSILSLINARRHFFKT